jgi:hypothetical protein
MVDGEHHFPLGSGHSMYGSAGSIQQRHDLMFNVAAVAAGYSVLRLHYQNKCLWEHAVLEFVEYCSACNPPIHKWVPAWKYISDAQRVWDPPCSHPSS